MARRREACQCLLSEGSAGVTAGQVSAHILSAGQSDKEGEGTIDMWPNSAEVILKNLGKINRGLFFLFSFANENQTKMIHNERKAECKSSRQTD